MHWTEQPCPHGKGTAGMCLRCAMATDEGYLIDVPPRHRLLHGLLPFRLSLTLAWYDFWIGLYFDRQKRRLYILPIPCVGICIQFPREPKHE